MMIYKEIINAAKSRASFFNHVSLRTVLLSGSGVWPDLRLCTYMAVHGERRCINIHTCLEVNLEICSRRSTTRFIWMKSILAYLAARASYMLSIITLTCHVSLNIKIKYLSRIIFYLYVDFIWLFSKSALYLRTTFHFVFSAKCVCFILPLLLTLLYDVILCLFESRWHTTFHAWKLITIAVWMFVVLLYYKVLMYRMVAYDMPFLHKWFSNNIRENEIYVCNWRYLIVSFTFLRTQNFCARYFYNIRIESDNV